MKKIIVLSLIFAFVLTSCSSEKASEIEKKNSIAQQFENIKGKGMLFGHQDDLAYGIDWKYVDGESDVKRVAGDYPALFGWELGGLERGDLVNLDSVPFDRMKYLAMKAHTMGGVNSFSWHPYSANGGVSSWDKEAEVVKHIIPGGSHHDTFKLHLDKVASFFKSLKTDKGSQMPFIFRPWHEMDGAWFWWGSEQCTPEEFQELFKFTINYLKNEKGVEEMLVAYSPDRNFNTLDEYYTWYPGDAYVDILGVDNYGDLKQENGELDAIKKLHLVIEGAKSKNKFAAFTETGLENVTDSLWYSKKLGAVLQDSIIAKEISYVMVWRNDPDVHYFFPHRGHKAESDAKKLLDRSNILLLEDFNKQK